jgi:hypothetical protein
MHPLFWTTLPGVHERNQAVFAISAIASLWEA